MGIFSKGYVVIIIGVIEIVLLKVCVVIVFGDFDSLCGVWCEFCDQFVGCDGFEDCDCLFFVIVIVDRGVYIWIYFVELG